MKIRAWQRLIAIVLSVQLAAGGLAGNAWAEMIGTQTAIESQQRSERIDRVDRFLARAEVRERLEAMGVAPEQARQRVDGLTDQELASLAQRIDELPAGAGALEVIGIVFLVLLLLDLVGVINIFNRI